MSASDIERINTTPVMSSVTIFNQVVYVSGQVPKNTQLDIEGQTREILTTIDQLLAQAKSDTSRLLSAQLFIKNLDDFSKVNAIWIEWLDGLATPARATIQADLVNPACFIEIAVIAAQE